MRISIPDLLITEPERVTRTQNAILDKLAAIQGVKSVGFASEMPMEGFDSDWDEIFAKDKVYSGRTDRAVAAVQEYFSRFFADGRDKISGGARDDVE